MIRFLVFKTRWWCSRKLSQIHDTNSRNQHHHVYLIAIFAHDRVSVPSLKYGFGKDDSSTATVRISNLTVSIAAAVLCVSPSGMYRMVQLLCEVACRF
jgi:hypothetical protein